MKKAITMLVGLVLALGLCAAPLTALAADAPNTLYVRNYMIKINDAPTYLKPDTAQGSLTEGSESDWTVKYEPSTATLTLKNATIAGGDNLMSLPYGAGIYALCSSGQSVALTIELIGENTIEGTFGIYVDAQQKDAIGTDASLTIKNKDNGSLNVTGTGNHGILVKSGSGNASLTIENATVTASTSVSYSAGVCVQSGISAVNSPSLSLAVNGGNLTAGAVKNSDGILFCVVSNAATGVNNSLTVSGNAVVDAKTGGIRAQDANLGNPDVSVGSGSSGTGGIVWDGTEGTVYGNVSLWEDLKIGEGESLSVSDTAGLNTAGHEIIVDGGALIGADKITGTVKYAPDITSASLPDGTVGTAYSHSLTASGDAPITWSVCAGSLPDGLSLDTDTGEISGVPGSAGSFSFTVQAVNAVGRGSRNLSINISPRPSVPSQPASYDWQAVLAGINALGGSGSIRVDVGSELSVPHFIWQAIYGKNITVTFVRGADSFVVNGASLGRNFDPDTGHMLTEFASVRTNPNTGVKL